MTGTVRLSHKSAEALRDHYVESDVGASPALVRALDELGHQLKRRPMKAARRERMAKRRKSWAEKKAETAAIYDQVSKRAGGICECGCGGVTEKLQMDHFWGRGRVRQSVETCWMLTWLCHPRKGSAKNLDALKRFLAHCKRHGYAEQARKAQDRIESIEAQAPKALGAPASPPHGGEVVHSFGYERRAARGKLGPPSSPPGGAP